MAVRCAEMQGPTGLGCVAAQLQLTVQVAQQRSVSWLFFCWIADGIHSPLSAACCTCTTGRHVVLRSILSCAGISVQHHGRHYRWSE